VASSAHLIAVVLHGWKLSRGNHTQSVTILNKQAATRQGLIPPAATRASPHQFSSTCQQLPSPGPSRCHRMRSPQERQGLPAITGTGCRAASTCRCSWPPGGPGSPLPRPVCTETPPGPPEALQRRTRAPKGGCAACAGRGRHHITRPKNGKEGITCRVHGMAGRCVREGGVGVCGVCRTGGVVWVDFFFLPVRNQRVRWGGIGREGMLSTCVAIGLN